MVSNVSKRIRCFDGLKSTSSVAILALPERLEEIAVLANRVQRGRINNVKQIHRLRVATRRAHVALRIFADVLPNQRRRRLAKQLRNLRRSCAYAHDLGGLIERLEPYETADAGIERVLDRIRDAFDSGKKPLRRVIKDLAGKRFANQCNGLLKRIYWRGPGSESSLQVTAAAELNYQIDRFLTQCETELSRVETIQRLRSFAKQTRYTIELTAGVYEEALALEVYPLITEFQRRTSGISDHHTALLLFIELQRTNQSKKVAKALDQLSRNEREQIDVAIRQFREWWSDYMILDLSARCERVLASPGRTPVSRKRSLVFCDG